MPPDIGELAEIYRHYKAGHLWNAGGSSEQPAVYLDAMTIINHWADKLQ